MHLCEDPQTYPIHTIREILVEKLKEENLSFILLYARWFLFGTCNENQWQVVYWLFQPCAVSLFLTVRWERSTCQAIRSRLRSWTLFLTDLEKLQDREICHLSLKLPTGNSDLISTVATSIPQPVDDPTHSRLIDPNPRVSCLAERLVSSLIVLMYSMFFSHPFFFFTVLQAAGTVGQIKTLTL